VIYGLATASEIPWMERESRQHILSPACRSMGHGIWTIQNQRGRGAWDRGSAACPRPPSADWQVLRLSSGFDAAGRLEGEQRLHMERRYWGFQAARAGLREFHKAMIVDMQMVKVFPVTTEWCSSQSPVFYGRETSITMTGSECPCRPGL